MWKTVAGWRERTESKSLSSSQCRAALDHQTLLARACSSPLSAEGARGAYRLRIGWKTVAGWQGYDEFTDRAIPSPSDPQPIPKRNALRHMSRHPFWKIFFGHQTKVNESTKPNEKHLGENARCGLDTSGGREHTSDTHEQKRSGEISYGEDNTGRGIGGG